MTISTSFSMQLWRFQKDYTCLAEAPHEDVSSVGLNSVKKILKTRHLLLPCSISDNPDSESEFSPVISRTFDHSLVIYQCVTSLHVLLVDWWYLLWMQKLSVYVNFYNNIPKHRLSTNTHAMEIFLLFAVFGSRSPCIPRFSNNCP